MKTAKYLSTISIILLSLLACEKPKDSMSVLERLRQSNNKKTYSSATMDSLQAIKSITQQKVQDVLDLSTLYLSGKGDTEIDSAIYKQLDRYFENPADTTKLKCLFEELDSLKVKNAKVLSLDVYKQEKNKDTLDFAKFDVQYFDANNKPIGTYTKIAQYILKSSPVKFKKEFKFYFLNFYQNSKDSTSSGKTKKFKETSVQ
ncbi:hypothetical protein [Riemerella columbipharyngis]|uniref:Lipoprotein n=1 Tax=Riemerella columbipharyngis TaxID=1071918 RepID=A0A1G7DY06_9FLAO|nr:hypothetical protein [Riemerella columbipharyngis]SDE56036.1 hypothetical protein SAMN05421544_11316 [Riemerella columbipharyngis]